MLQVQVQEQIQKLHFNELVKAIGGDGVISGLEVTAAGGMDLNVSAGEAIIGGTRVSFSATTVTIPAADPLYPRKDLVVAKSDGSIAVVQGTPDSPLPSDRTGVFTVTPRPPDPPSGSIILAEIWVPAGATEITSGDITDRRIFVAPSEYAADKIYADQIAEKTAGAGITLLSVSKHQGGIQTDSISELTSGARVSLPSGLKTDTIEEYTSGARVSFPHGIKTDRIEEKTSGAGIDIGAGSLYVNQSLKLIRWKQKKYALYFNGNAYVNCGNPSSLQITGDLTIEVRIIPHKLNAFQGIVSKNYLYEYEVAIYSANNGLAYRHGDGTNQDSIQFNNFFEDVDVPVTITVVRDSANKVVSAYKNGEFFGQHSYTVDPAVGSYDLEIGRRSGDGYYFDGKIFYVRIYNRILTESEIKYNCNNPQSPVTDGLVLWLNFDGGYGDKAYDLSGYGNHGTAYNCEWVEEEIYAGSRFPGNRFGLLYAAEIRQLGAGGINLGDGTLYVDQANKRVGIGTTSPAVKLHVAGFARVDETFQINKGTVAGGLRHIELMSGGLLRIGIGLVGDETGDNAGADLAIWRYSDTGGYLGNVMKVIRSTGNVAFCDNRIVFEQADIIIRPYTDNVGSVGTDSYRWALVRAVTVTQGDIGFGPEDQPCPVCGKKFEVGDVVVLKVHKVLESGEFRARPIHLKCAG